MSDPWYKAIWSLFDGLLRGVSDTLQSILKGLRAARVTLFLLCILFILTAVLVVLRPEWSHFVLAGVLLIMMFPFLAMLVLVWLPFRAKSFIRLVDMGYPDNVKELTIRAAARKLHDESIESEELLVEAAMNEGRKAVRKYRGRLERLKSQLDAMEADLKASEATADASERRGQEDTGPPPMSPDEEDEEPEGGRGPDEDERQGP